ncbi:PilZ domain-containing protein [Proteinivorax tanatarense]|uniref:PilZ domain-containing protein n=1 Tax=Proteinivorax tanatarense TaxID=1260629 RepID=A0AAU7VQL2_9FIRM
MEKRGFYRISLAHKIEYVKLDPTTLNVTSSSQEGLLYDISGGGASFYSTFILDINELIELALETQDGQLVILAKVLRKVKKDESNYYAIKFLHINQDTEKQLIKFINYLQNKSS